MSCQDPNMLGEVWLRASAADTEPAALRVWAWTGRTGNNQDNVTYTPIDAALCPHLLGDAGAIVHVPSLLQALTRHDGAAYVRQILFRLGIENMGDAQMQLHKDAPGRLSGEGVVAWPSPHRGPISALGTAQPLVTPDIVSPSALGYLAVSISPGRLWQEMEALAGGLWPIETTLIGTQIGAWEQAPGHGELAQDVLGYASTMLTAVVMPAGQGARLVWSLPVKKPEVAMAFVQWAIEVTSAFAPSLSVRPQVVQGRKVLAVRGLLRVPGGGSPPVFLAADGLQMFASTDAASLVTLLQQKAQPTGAPSIPHDAGAPDTAVAFGKIEHAALSKNLWRQTLGASPLQGFGLDPKGCSFGWAEASADGFTWHTSSMPKRVTPSRRRAPAPAPAPAP